MDSPRTLPLQTAHNPSSSPKSSWILNKTLPLQTVHNPPSSLKSRWTLHKTLLLQTVHNLPSSPTGPAEFATKHRPHKLFTTFPASKVQQNSPPKPTSESCSQPPHFPRVQQDCPPHPAPASSTQPTQTKPYPASCFQPPQKPKVKTEQYIHPTVQAVKVVRSSLNQQCLGF